MCAFYESPEMLQVVASCLDATSIAMCACRARARSGAERPPRLSRVCKFVPGHLSSPEALRFVASLRGALRRDVSTLEQFSLADSILELRTDIRFRFRGAARPRRRVRGPAATSPRRRSPSRRARSSPWRASRASCSGTRGRPAPRGQQRRPRAATRRSMTVSIEAHCGLEAPRAMGYSFARERARSVRAAVVALGVARLAGAVLRQAMRGVRVPRRVLETFLDAADADDDRLDDLEALLPPLARSARRRRRQRPDDRFPPDDDSDDDDDAEVERLRARLDMLAEDDARGAAPPCRRRARVARADPRATDGNATLPRANPRAGPVLQRTRTREDSGPAAHDTCTLCMTWQVYLSGEIHSDWREVIAAGVADRELPVELAAPITSHEDSDDCGAVILGDEASRPNYDGKGARLNLIRADGQRDVPDVRGAELDRRTRTLIDAADVVVVRFGDKYRQWNAAFDAGYATARGKALVLDYVVTGALPAPRDGDAFVPMMERAGPGNPNP
ncbi:nucleoside 2-deoxyribosyltransferase YtoQ [Aureococcus anophagefferens]|nr:nucleoside 2-deoxyribosyltransferase YtoQ [Aureococcus anophagefferens]